MGVWDRDLWGNVGSDVGVVDHSESLWNHLGDMGGKWVITDSGHTISVKGVNCTENLLNIQGSYHAQSSTERESGNPDLSSSKESSQSLNVLPDISFDSLESVIESLMDKALLAAREGDLSSIEIGNPILNINFTLESNNDRIIGLGKSGKPMDIKNIIGKGLSLG